MTNSTTMKYDRSSSSITIGGRSDADRKDGEDESARVDGLPPHDDDGRNGERVGAQSEGTEQQQEHDGGDEHQQPQHIPVEFREHGLATTSAGLLGNLVEVYDFALFGSLGDVIGEVFFPPSSNDGSNTSLVETYAILGGALLMRPVGGAIIGYVGDVYGRKRALFVSITMMATFTFLMAILPSYQVAGNWAIALLTLVRLGQGMSEGGEFPSSLVFTGIYEWEREIAVLFVPTFAFSPYVPLLLYLLSPSCSGESPASKLGVLCDTATCHGSFRQRYCRPLFVCAAG